MQRRTKTVIVAALTALALYAFTVGGGAAAKTDPVAAPSPSATAVVDEEPAHNAAPDQMAGLYTGAFGHGKITVCLQKIVGQSVLGYSVVLGNERAFSGSFAFTGGVPYFVVKEPNDDPEDGEFRFHIPIEAPQLVGTWTAYDKKLAPVDFTLVKREFHYNPKIGKYPQSSTTLLKARDVSNLRREDLRIMRNEIYARHGYSFKLKDMREYFDHQDWYMPMASDVSAQLTALEQKNHALIKRYEDYSEEYYDSYGR